MHDFLLSYKSAKYKIINKGGDFDYNLFGKEFQKVIPFTKYRILRYNREKGKMYQYLNDKFDNEIIELGEIYLRPINNKLMHAKQSSSPIPNTTITVYYIRSDDYMNYYFVEYDHGFNFSIHQYFVIWELYFKNELFFLKNYNQKSCHHFQPLNDFDECYAADIELNKIYNKKKWKDILIK
ncbi:MAG: hypothetical protein SFU98_12195 [Leptospiraceae bacterium]|nr:hypothetical protein [Leptospiraceae bacterium]